MNESNMTFRIIFLSCVTCLEGFCIVQIVCIVVRRHSASVDLTHALENGKVRAVICSKFHTRAPNFPKGLDTYLKGEIE